MFEPNWTHCLCVCWLGKKWKDESPLKSHTCLDMRVVSNGRLLSLIVKVLIYSGISDANMLLQCVYWVSAASSPAFDMCDWQRHLRFSGQLIITELKVLSSVGWTCEMNHCSSQDLRIWVVPQCYSYMNYRPFHSLYSCTKLTCGLDSLSFSLSPRSVCVLSVCFYVSVPGGSIRLRMMAEEFHMSFRSEMILWDFCGHCGFCCFGLKTELSLRETRYNQIQIRISSEWGQSSDFSSLAKEIY